MSLDRIEDSLRRELQRSTGQDPTILEHAFAQLRIGSLETSTIDADARRILEGLEEPTGLGNFIRSQIADWRIVRPQFQRPRPFLDISNDMLIYLLFLHNVMPEEARPLRAIPKVVATKLDYQTHAQVDKHENGEVSFLFSSFLLASLQLFSYFLANYLMTSLPLTDSGDIDWERAADHELRPIEEHEQVWLADLLVHFIAREKWAISSVQNQAVLKSEVYSQLSEILRHFLICHEIGHLFLGHLDSAEDAPARLLPDNTRSWLIEQLSAYDVPDAEGALSEFESQRGRVFLDELDADVFAYRFVGFQKVAEGVDSRLTHIGVFALFELLDWFEDYRYRKMAGFEKKDAWVDDVLAKKSHPFAFTRMAALANQFLEDPRPLGGPGPNSEVEAMQYLEKIWFPMRNNLRMPKLQATALLEQLAKSNGDFSVFSMNGKYRKVTDHTSEESIRELERHLKSLRS